MDTEKQLYEVVMYDAGDVPVASALVEASGTGEAHEIAMRLMRAKYPAVDPSKYNQTLVSAKLFRG